MSALHTSLVGLFAVVGLLIGSPCCGSEAASVHEPDTIDPQKTDGTPADRSFQYLPFGRNSGSSSDRLTRIRHDIEMRRRQREVEVEALRSVRKADREAWRKRWDQQRQRAREESLERERLYLRDLSKRSPELAKYRKRHAEELERRRQAFEKERRARWKALDKLEY
jgi:hypothetical protein